MAYFDALIAKWPSVTGATTAAKLVNLNGQTVAAPLPAILNVVDIINAIVPADFTGLTQLQVSQMTLLLGGAGTVNASPGTTIRSVFQTIFSGKATTLANLSALVSPFDNATIPWWQANGYGGPIQQNDLTAAGGLS